MLNSFINKLKGKIPEEYIKPWKWDLPDEACEAPYGMDPRTFKCIGCGIRGPLFRVVYDGKSLYVCRNCGNVNEIYYDEKYHQNSIRTWRELLNQPYYWYPVIKNKDGSRSLAYDMINCSGDIKKHPLINAHCTGDKTETAEMLVRYLLYADNERFSRFRFFLRNPDDLRISNDNDTLDISSGKEGGTFPGDDFCIFREEKDLISFEYNHIVESNVFGFTLDLNDEDWEYTAYCQSIKISYIGDKRSALPSDMDVLDSVPLLSSVKPSWITKDPFGLNGYFLFETSDDSYEFGCGSESDPRLGIV